MPPQQIAPDKQRHSDLFEGLVPPSRKLRGFQIRYCRLRPRLGFKGSDARPKVVWLATTTKLKWTVCGRLFPTTRSTTRSRPMVALTSALRDRWVPTRALYSVSFCLWRGDGSTGRVANAEKRKSHIKSGAVS